MRVLMLYRDPRVVRLLGPLLPDVRFSSVPTAGPWDLVIRWGYEEGGDGHHRLLNPASALQMIQDASAVARACGANRIPHALVLHGRRPRRGGRGVPPHYRVDLFDLGTVAVHRWDGARYRAFPWRGVRALGTVRQMARRALYACGLHFGAVLVGNAGDRLAVLGVDGGPSLSPGLARAYAGAINPYLQTAAAYHARLGALRAGLPAPAPASEVVLGCDPEFVLRRMSTGRLVPASRFFPRGGRVGLDRAGFWANGMIHRPIAELRPGPSPSPHQLVENLRQGMLRAALAVRGRGIRFQAGSLGARGYPIGGHIHFSNLRPGHDLLKALDNYLAVPILLLEDPATSRSRRPRYGALGDFRMQPHGGFEYRTLPSWIFSPEFSLAVLCLAKLIALDYPVLRRNVLATGQAQADFYQARKEVFRPYFELLWDDLTAAPSFATYGQDIGLLRSLVEGEKRWRERRDIKRRWLRPDGSGLP